ncbi:MAG: hypothetical protein Q8L23_11430 [Caulobacter sp.]|nr:hypothetical protein [Caulobacter sp.]
MHDQSLQLIAVPRGAVETRKSMTALLAKRLAGLQAGAMQAVDFALCNTGQTAFALPAGSRLKVQFGDLVDEVDLLRAVAADWTATAPDRWDVEADISRGDARLTAVLKTPLEIAADSVLTVAPALPILRTTDTLSRTILVSFSRGSGQDIATELSVEFPELLDLPVVAFWEKTAAGSTIKLENRRVGEGFVAAPLFDRGVEFPYRPRIVVRFPQLPDALPDRRRPYVTRPGVLTAAEMAAVKLTVQGSTSWRLAADPPQGDKVLVLEDLDSGGLAPFGSLTIRVDGLPSEPAPARQIEVLLLDFPGYRDQVFVVRLIEAATGPVIQALTVTLDPAQQYPDKGLWLAKDYRATWQVRGWQSRQLWKREAGFDQVIRAETRIDSGLDRAETIAAMVSGDIESVWLVASDRANRWATLKRTITHAPLKFRCGFDSRWANLGGTDSDGVERLIAPLGESIQAIWDFRDVGPEYELFCSGFNARGLRSGEETLRVADQRLLTLEIRTLDGSVVLHKQWRTQPHVFNFVQEFKNRNIRYWYGRDQDSSKTKDRLRVSLFAYGQNWQLVLYVSHDKALWWNKGIKQDRQEIKVEFRTSRGDLVGQSVSATNDTVQATLRNQAWGGARRALDLHQGDGRYPMFMVAEGTGPLPRPLTVALLVMTAAGERGYEPAPSEIECSPGAEAFEVHQFESPASWRGQSLELTPVHTYRRKPLHAPPRVQVR